MRLVFLVVVFCTLIALQASAQDMLPNEALVNFIHKGRFYEASQTLEAQTKGDPSALRSLAMMYFRGDGARMDAQVAYILLFYAALHEANGAEKDRTLQDLDLIQSSHTLTRREKDYAVVTVEKWLKERGEGDLATVDRINAIIARH